MPLLPRPHALAIVLLALLSIVAACGDNNTIESPTSPTPSTIADASTSEGFDDTLSVNGSAFYSFSVAQYGTVNVTLTEISGTHVPSTAWIGLGLGTPSGTDCVTTTAINTAPGAGPHLTGTYETGVYCVKVWDIGNLAAAARFRVSIAHP